MLSRYAIGDAERGKGPEPPSYGWLDALADQIHMPYTANGTAGGPTIKVNFPRLHCSSIQDYFRRSLLTENIKLHRLFISKKI